MNHGNDESNVEKSAEVVRRFLEFDLGKESYAVPLLSIKEVITVPDTTPLPNSPAYFMGIMNLRGQIISVMDLRKKLKITPKEEELEESVVIVDFEDLSIGLVVDSINKVISFSSSDLVEVPEVQSQVNAQFIHGVFKGTDKLTVILDLEKILNIPEVRKQTKRAA